MAGLDHGPAHPVETEDEVVVARNTRLGLRLFAIYLVLYIGFVLLTAFGRNVLADVEFRGTNLAIWYGFTLIAAALGLALVYAWMCRGGASRPGARQP